MKQPEDTEFERAANRREEIHKDSPTSRPLSSMGCERVGLAGERAFAERYGLPVDLTDRPNGDGGTDFVLETKHGPFHVDVKTAQIPKWLLVEAKKVLFKRIYVLAMIEPDGRVALLGWEWGAALLRSEARDYGGKGIISHAVVRTDLRPMSQLDDVVIPF